MDKFSDWEKRLSCSKKKLSEEIDSLSKFRDAYFGKFPNSNQNTIEINYLYADIRSAIPKLYSKDPYIFIDPLTPEADLNAEILEKVVNAKLEDWNLKSVVRDAIKLAKLDGKSYIKTSYKYSDKKNDLIDGINDEIYLECIDRESLVLDQSARSFKECAWVAHKIYEPIHAIKAKFKLKNNEKPCAFFEEKSELDSSEHDDKLGMYYEIEDRQNRKLITIVDGVRRVVEEKDHPYKFYSMYEVLEFNSLPFCLDSKPDIHFWWKLLLDLNDNKTRQYKHRKKLNAKYITSGPSKLSDSQINDLKSSDDSIVVQLPVGTSVIPFQHAQMGQEIYIGEQSTRQDITIISGMNEMKQGLPSSVKTAREAMAIVAESDDIVSDRASLVEDFIGKIIQKCVFLIQEFYDTTRVVELTGLNEAELLGLKDRFKESYLGDSRSKFVSFVGTKLSGKMKVRIKAGSTMPVSDGSRQNSMMQFNSMIAQNPQLSAQVDPQELLKELIRLFKIENKGLVFDPKTPEQENALLKRDIPVMPHISENHEAHITAHEIENNKTPAFIAHIVGHKLLDAFLQKSKLNAQMRADMVEQQPDLGGLDPNAISGSLFGGGNVPAPAPQPEASPQQQPPQVAAQQQI